MPTTKNVPSVQIKSQNNVADFFFILEGLFIMNLYQLDKQSSKFAIWKYWKGCMKKLDRKDPNFLATHGNLHHDNAPAHTALSVREFLATKQITVLEHPAYSPELAPSDFLLFPKLKEILKEGILMTLMTLGVQKHFQNCF